MKISNAVCYLWTKKGKSKKVIRTVSGGDVEVQEGIGFITYQGKVYKVKRQQKKTDDEQWVEVKRD